MKHYLFPLTFEEQEIAANKGYRYAIQNKKRWVELGEAEGEINTYDRGTTNLVYKNVVYNIHKDYVNIDEQYRVYIGCDMNLSYDRLVKDNEALTWGSTSNTQKVSTERTIEPGVKISDVLTSIQGDTGSIILAEGTYPDAVTSQIPYILTIKGNMSGKSALIESRANDTTTDESVISGAIKLTGESYVVLDGITFTKTGSISLVDFKGNLTVTNCKFVGVTAANAILADEKSKFKLDVSRCYFSGGSVTNAISVKGELISSTIVRNKFTSSFCSGQILDFSDSFGKTTIGISRNICEKPNLLSLSLKENRECEYILSKNEFKTMDKPFVNVKLSSGTLFRNISISIDGTTMPARYVPITLTTDIPKDKRNGKLPIVKVNSGILSPDLFVQ